MRHAIILALAITGALASIPLTFWDCGIRPAPPKFRYTVTLRP